MVQFHGQHERLALHCLGLAGFETWCPRIRERKIICGRRTIVTPASVSRLRLRADRAPVARHPAYTLRGPADHERRAACAGARSDDRGTAGKGSGRDRKATAVAATPDVQARMCGSPAGPSVVIWGCSPGWRRTSGLSSCCHCLGANSASACRRATWRQSYRTRCPGGAAGPDKRTGEATALEFGGLFSPRPVDWMPGIERPPIRADIRPIAALLDQLLAVQNLLTSPRWGTTWSQSIAGSTMPRSRQNLQSGCCASQMYL